jgi:uncharacterized RDD family membrane protein YckC
MAFCAKCGKELPAGATFCPNCGAPVGAATAGAAPGAAAASAPASGFETLTRDQKAQEYWIQRLVAFIIDAIIVYAVLAVLFIVVAFPAFIFGGFGFGFFFGAFAFLWGLIFVLYFAVLESSSGATIGKRIFQLKVRSKTGSNPNFAEAFIRSLSKIYWLLLLLDVIVGLALSKGYQQKYSDQLMGTTVVHT